MVCSEPATRMTAWSGCRFAPTCRLPRRGPPSAPAGRPARALRDGRGGQRAGVLAAVGVEGRVAGPEGDAEPLIASSTSRTRAGQSRARSPAEERRAPATTPLPTWLGAAWRCGDHVSAAPSASCSPVQNLTDQNAPANRPSRSADASELRAAVSVAAAWNAPPAATHGTGRHARTVRRSMDACKKACEKS